MSSRWVLSVFLITSLSISASAQPLIRGFTRELAIHNLPTGFALKSFDVTGDSVSELLITSSGRFLIFDGKTFNTLFQDSTTPGVNSLSPADVNRDGVTDLVAVSGDSEIVVWYGPDFLNRRIFPVPRGFSTFAVRNREDGQIEFAFGFPHSDSSCGIINPSDCLIEFWGYVLRYTDTTFTFSDSFNVDISPGPYGEMTYIDVIGSGQRDLILVGYYSSYRSAPPYGTYWDLLVERVHGLQLFSVLSFPIGYSCYLNPCNRCSSFLRPILETYATGNIDVDSAIEFVAFVSPTLPCRPSWSFCAYDFSTATKQWERTDSLDIRALFTVDLNRSAPQEILAYEIQAGKPGLVEYRTSDGATLGYSELPFTPSTLLMGTFGSPPAPKVLLAHGDSVVVYGIDVATAVRELPEETALPRQATLFPPSPNPFNGETAITYSIPATGNVSVRIIDILGREVRTLVAAAQKAGRYQVTWDATDDQGRSVGSGIYFAVLRGGGSAAAQKIVLLK